MTDDKEVRILDAIHSMAPGPTRRTMMQLAAAAGLSLAMTPAVSRIVEAAVQRGKIGMLGLTPAIDYWSIFQRSFRQVSAALQLEGVEYFYNMDLGREVSQVRGLSAASIKMVNGYVYPDGGLPTIAKMCQDQGIYFADVWDTPAWFTPPDIGDYYVNFLTPNSVKEAYEVAKILIKSIGGEGKIATIRGLAAMTDLYRYNGLVKAAKEHPGITIVDGPRANWDRQKARDATVSLLTAHPDIKGFFPTADDMAFGTLSVLRERKLDGIKVASVVGLPEGLKEVAKGENFVATASDLPVYQCGFSAVAAFDALNGWKPTLGERMLHYESILCTAENAAAVNQRIYAPDATPYDWVKMSRTLTPEGWDPQNGITAIEPDVFWADVPDGKEKLNALYKDAKARGEFDKVNALYAAHYKTGPNKQA